MTEETSTDNVRNQCKALLDRLYLPEGHRDRITATEFGILIKKLMDENEVKVEVVHKAHPIVEKARELFNPVSERGCPVDKDGGLEAERGTK